MPQWNPDLYLTFGEQRTRPAIDLALRARTLLERSRNTGEQRLVLDLGCGPGNSTAVLASVFGGARLVGVDSSPDMITKAREGDVPAEWCLADATLWVPGQAFDLVFSNAMLQWVPDQVALLARMWCWLLPGGVLAVQVPGNSGSGLHQALRQVAARRPWCDRFEGLDDLVRYREPDFYYETLASLGGSVDLWETTYWHVLDGPRSLIQWYSGTGMRPWLERLAGEPERQVFQEAVLRAAVPSYPPRKDGTILFPFRRIFVTAIRPTG